MKKVMVTGVTGLVGSHIAAPLKNLGYTVYGISRKSICNKEFHSIPCDLLNPKDIAYVMAEVRPQYLIHLAWTSLPQIYLEDPSNTEWVDCGMELLAQFHQYGGKRALCAGTCFEYQFQTEPLKEDGPLNPLNAYAKAKCLFYKQAMSYAQQCGLSFAWGRIFYVYGFNEHLGRLFPNIITNLRQNKEVLIKTSHLIKDYMFAPDIAAAFATLLHGGVTGAVNICSGRGRSVGEIAKTIGNLMGKSHLLRLEERSTTQPPIIIGANQRLINEAGFNAYTPFEDAVASILQTNESQFT